MADREPQLLLDTFVELADTLASDYDVGDLLQMLVDRCVELRIADTAGVLLEREAGRPTLAAAATAEMLAIERLELRLGEGPSFDAYHTGQVVLAEDMEQCRDRWPQVIPPLLDLGMRAAAGIPLHLRGDRIGALNLYRREPSSFDPEAVRLAQALADMAAVGILQERSLTRAEQRSAQLQHALDSRVVIEQAKGVVAERRGVSPVEAFAVLRAHARDRNRRLHDVCREIVAGELEV